MYSTTVYYYSINYISSVISGKYCNFIGIQECDNVQYTDIPKISVFNSISVYQYDFFNYTDILEFLIYRNFSITYNNNNNGHIIDFASSR